MACSVGGLNRVSTYFSQIKGGKGWVPYALCGMVGARSRFEDSGVGVEVGRSIADDVDLGKPSRLEGVGGPSSQSTAVLPVQYSRLSSDEHLPVSIPLFAISVISALVS